MSKKKKKWWEKGWGSYKDAFSDSGIPSKQSRMFDEDGIEILEEDKPADPMDRTRHRAGYYNDDYYGSVYQDDWGRSLEKKEGSNYSNNQAEYGSAYSSYEKTGVWGGYSYYRTPQLSYKYVQQMANALAAQHRITLEIGNTWEVDLIKKKLKYNPSSLIYGTKSQLLATLLHEIGKLRYMDHYTTLQNRYLVMYKEAAAEAFIPFEDVRVDYQMLRAYESAAELYESAIPKIQENIETYYKYGKAFRKASVEILKYYYDSLVNKPVQDPEEQKIKLLQHFGTHEPAKIQERIQEISKFYQTHGSLYEYCGDMLNVMYDLETPHSGFNNIKEKVEASVPAIEPIKREVGSQGAIDIMDKQVFPHIEDLMKDVKDKTDQIKEMFPGMLQEIAEQMAQQMKQLMDQELGRQRIGEGYGGNQDNGQQGQMNVPNANKKGKNGIRGGSGPTDSRIPPEWVNGDYKPLKDSMDAEIKSLIRKLTFLRREEMTNKFEHNQKRGKLNSRKLVKHAFGSRRLFKQKLPNIDTVQSFAFSVLMDVSGSMSGPRIVHTTRAIVLFNEVFKKLQIPFEFVIFDDGVNVVKSFDAPSDKNVEKEIAGLVNYDGGGTNLDAGLDALKIHTRPEKNKIVIVLTDGGVGQAGRFDLNYFIPWREKKGIKSLAFGIETNESEMRKLCEGTGREIETANQLPVEFAELLKNLIKRKK